MNNEKWYQNWSWLEYLNFFILQWLFIRLAKYKEINEFQFTEISLCEGGIGIGGTVEKSKWKFKIIGLIFPLSGWWSNYIYFVEMK
jgi:hypothetical protein